MTATPPAAPPRGRFAPSPTGALHFGSLVAAVGSYADARAAGGQWLVRVDDLDREREVAGAADLILRALDRFGLHWDGVPVYQSRRTDAYAQALAKLRERGLTFPCGCSRREIAARGRPGPEGPIYPGTCRNGLPPGRLPRSERLRMTADRLIITDRIHGEIVQHSASEVGDFVLRRADGIHAYQLAVVIDDADAGIDRVVRGADLLLSTPRHVHLQRLLDLPTPTYAHLPVALSADGHKLSKSHAALPVDPDDPLPALLGAWRFLSQPMPPEPPESVAAFWHHAIDAWSIDRVPRRRAIPVAGLPAND